MTSKHHLESGQWVDFTLPDALAVDEAAAQDWVNHGWEPSLRYFAASEQFRSEPEGLALKAVSRASLMPDSATIVEMSKPISLAADAGTAGGLLVRRRSVRWYDAQKAASTLELEEVLRQSQKRILERIPAAFTAVGVHVLTYNVEGSVPGVYDVATDGSISLTRSADLRDQMVEIMCGMEAAGSAIATVVLTFDATARQVAYPYERGLRELYVDAGRIAQWFILELEIAGFGSLITPATNDPVLSQVMSLSDGVYPLYTITFGVPS